MPRTRAAHSNSSQQPAKRPMLVSASSGNLEEQIRQRAYELYELRGREDGFAEEDWARAERELLARRGPRSA